MDENEKSRIDGLRVAVSILALFALAALLFTRGIPTVQPGAQTKPSPATYIACRVGGGVRWVEREWRW